MANVFKFNPFNPKYVGVQRLASENSSGPSEYRGWITSIISTHTFAIFISRHLLVDLVISIFWRENNVISLLLYKTLQRKFPNFSNCTVLAMTLTI